MKLEQQVGRLFQKATNAAADIVIKRTQQGKSHDDHEAMEFIKIKMSAIEQALLLIAGKVDEITHPEVEAEDSPLNLP